MKPENYASSVDIWLAMANVQYYLGKDSSDTIDNIKKLNQLEYKTPLTESIKQSLKLDNEVVFSR